jgi:hypothetical protein
MNLLAIFIEEQIAIMIDILKVNHYVFASWIE